MSDTHMQNITYNVPDGDIFIHAGDFSNLGQRQSVIKFNNWLGSLPHKFKVVIAGNHELTFDARCLNYFQQIMFIRGKSSAIEDVMHVRDYLTNCIYLQDSGIQLYGVKIYGSPWIPVHYGVGGAFSRYRGRDLLSQWNKIPRDTEILVTHTPPVGHGDLVQSGIRVGCVELLNTVLYRVRPKYHIFGHIHEGYGVTSNGEISFVNASSCNVKKNAVNLPIVFDMPLKYGYRK
ncbi:unnamed protein product [Acanthoscelides obtectus]|uniref:Calcineurin-like phosphoesterase domain-containing protein n=1 Tax=Acanthoscelides obtectus TaxID=200917 RepID=A0A9P0Q6B9_ACAOB|nr:unnamed protein product [Acanthoscelides obtectus]CAK1652826.1 Metallophosphoesterase domain-containing protein 1 [Acanthoscelides obtectus]